MRALLIALAAALLVGCGSGGGGTRDVPAGETKARPNQGYDGANGGK